MENNGRLLQQQQQQQQQQFALQQQAFAPLAQQMLTNPSFVSVYITKEDRPLLVIVFVICLKIASQRIFQCVVLL